MKDLIPEQTPTGIHIPEQLRTRYQFSNARWCEVVAVGSGRRTKKGHTVPIECFPADRVLCHFDAAQAIPNRENLWSIPYAQVLAILPKSEPRLSEK